MSRDTIQTLSFIAVIIMVTVAFVWLLLPYYGAILWAVILAILFNPLQRRLEALLRGRRNLAAALNVLVCICIVIIPVSLVLASLAQEAAGLYNRVGTREFDPAGFLARVHAMLPPFIADALSRLNLGDLEDVRARLTSWLMQASQAVATWAVGIGQNTAHFLVSLGIMLYLLFFLFRDGTSLTATIRKSIPLSDRYTDHILGRFGAVVMATVKGNITIAAIQGAIGGVTFWMLGVGGAVLWGVLMAVLSLLPAVGAGLVWLPTAGYLLLSGDYLKGAILFAIGTLIISTVDNLLRPSLVGKVTCHG